MADRIKTVSTYNGTSWGSEVPIGADASNVDVTLSNNTKSDLQTVLGSTPSGSSVTERINSKISTSGGDVADTVISKNINNYDSSTTAGDDILTDTAATMSTNTSTLWSRFNLFRKKVSNNFANYFLKSNLVGLDPGVGPTGNDNTVYTTLAINNYLSNVIGYTSASAPEAGDVATQLSTLNSNWTDHIHWRYDYLPSSSHPTQYSWHVLSIAEKSLAIMWSFTSGSYSASSWKSWGSMYYTPSTPSLGYPSEISFSIVPYVWTGGRILHTDAWWCPSTAGELATTTNIGGLYAVRPNKPTLTITLEPHFLVMGTYDSFTPPEETNTDN